MDKVIKAEELTANNQALTLNVAANYGGRWDIVNAAKQISKRVLDGEMSVNDINEDNFDSHICMADLPPLDLLIRTGGEHRISNFLLWQCAYAEFYFTSTLWPDFDEQAFADAVDDFNDRQRRFGLTGEQVTSQC